MKELVSDRLHCPEQVTREKMQQYSSSVEQDRFGTGLYGSVVKWLIHAALRMLCPKGRVGSTPT